MTNKIGEKRGRPICASGCAAGQAGLTALAMVTLVGATLVAGCGSTGGGPSGPATWPVNPFCSVMIAETIDAPRIRQVMSTTRTDQAAANHFTRVSGRVRLNPFVVNDNESYGWSEVWFRRVTAPVVIRATSHPAPRSSSDNQASRWALDMQDLTGAWSAAPFATGSANAGNEIDDATAGALTTPQLMSVGVANPQVFACAGTRTEDNALRTTSLFEVVVPPPGTTAPSTRFIQDLLYGDDRFVPNRSGPLIGPANPPTPRVAGVGDQAGDGAVLCAMTQVDDDVTTRQLHMIARRNGGLYLSVADQFGTATSESGATSLRFSRVSPWQDVGQALGGAYGQVVSAAIVASRPAAVSILFVAQTGAQYRTYHAVRFSSGVWRPTDDVLALRDGTGAIGALSPFNVAAGMCPMYPETSADRGDEIVYVLWRDNDFASVGRIISTSRTWPNSSITGIYSPMSRLDGLMRSVNPTRNHRLTRFSIAARPFPNGTPP